MVSASDGIDRIKKHLNNDLKLKEERDEQARKLYEALEGVCKALCSSNETSQKQTEGCDERCNE
jgi:hypothetical protein